MKRYIVIGVLGLLAYQAIAAFVAFLLQIPDDTHGDPIHFGETWSLLAVFIPLSLLASAAIFGSLFGAGWGLYQAWRWLSSGEQRRADELEERRRLREAAERELDQVDHTKVERWR